MKIKLSESSDANVFEKHNLIHETEFNRVIKFIETAVSEVEVSGKSANLRRIRRHDAITVLGTRGSGKTSFMISLQEECKKSKDIVVLNMIDPTLIEEKGHVFLNVISLIKDAVEEKLDKISSDRTHSNSLSRKRWQQLVGELAHGLPSIDGIGGQLSERSWQDPEYIMDRGIRSITAASSLEENFKNLIKEGLAFLEKKAFLLCFDDIDIDFAKGWRVLECIRKYFTFPQLIIVISGDLNLFSKSIRKRHWQNFGKALLINEVELLNKMPGYNMVVTEMEEQYLSKVLKPERRIHLVTLREKINFDQIVTKVDSAQKDLNDRFSIIVINEKEEIELLALYEHILGKFGIYNSYELAIYRSFLLSLPLRSQIRLMKAFYKGNEIEELSITDLFLSYLLEKSVNVNLLHNVSKFQNTEALYLLMREKELKNGFMLQPTMLGPSLNACLTAFSFLFSWKVSHGNSYLIFDYFIKIGYTRNLLSTFGYPEEKGGEVRFRVVPSIQGLIMHSGLYTDKGLQDIVGLINSYIWAYLDKEKSNFRPWGGTIPIRALAVRTKQGQKDAMTRIDAVFGKLSLQQRTLAYIPCSVCKFPTKQETLVVYSIYSLLGAIGELIKGIQVGGLASRLFQLSDIIAYDMPDFKNGVNTSSRIPMDSNEKEDAMDDTDDSETTLEHNDLSNLKNLIELWGRSIPEKRISPHLLGKISTKMHTAFINIESSTRTSTLGSAMSNRIIAFMNSVLVEDVIENSITDISLNINNTNSSYLIFKYNLDKAFETPNHSYLFSFSQWLLSCPLLFAYLNFKDDIKHKLMVSLRKYCGISEDQLNRLKNLSIFEELETLPLR